LATSKVRQLVALAALLAVAMLASGCALLGMGIAPSPPPERAVVLRWMLFSPNDNPESAWDVPLADPSWAAAEASAREASDRLRAIPDPVERATAFADLARSVTDDPGTRASGGDLGTVLTYVLRERLGDDIFDRSSLAPGDIVGPVRTPSGWHLFLYEGEGDPDDAR
jgi:hypothetical protein